VSEALAPWTARQLQALLAQRGHAWLLQGPSGLGQFELALAMVRAWLCDQPTPQGACGHCPSCHGIDVHAHPDLVVLMPETEMLARGWPLPERAQAEIDDKKRKPSRDIRVDAMREAIEFAQRTSGRGRGKALLIYPAERMNAVTANALLKTLEEPPGDARFVLASDAAHLLLPTIRSRCQALRVSLPAEAEALAWLKPMTQGFDAVTLLHLAHGAPLRARTLAQPELLALRDRLFTGFVAVSLGKRDPLNEAGAWNQADPAVIFDWLGGWVSDLLRLAVVATQAAGGGPRRLINADKERELRALVLYLDAAAAHRFLQRLWRTGASDTTNLNRLLLFESWLLEWVASCVPGAASGPLR